MLSVVTKDESFVRQMLLSSAYQSEMIARKTVPGAIQRTTHYLLDGGCLCISPDEYMVFLKNYLRDVQELKLNMFICEVNGRSTDEVVPMFFELDILLESAPLDGLWVQQKDFVEMFVKTIWYISRYAFNYEYKVTSDDPYEKERVYIQESCYTDARLIDGYANTARQHTGLHVVIPRLRIKLADIKHFYELCLAYFERHIAPEDYGLKHGLKWQKILDANPYNPKSSMRMMYSYKTVPCDRGDCQGQFCFACKGHGKVCHKEGSVYKLRWIVEVGWPISESKKNERLQLTRQYKTLNCMSIQFKDVGEKYNVPIQASDLMACSIRQFASSMTGKKFTANYDMHGVDMTDSDENKMEVVHYNGRVMAKFEKNHARRYLVKSMEMGPSAPTPIFREFGQVLSRIISHQPVTINNDMLPMDESNCGDVFWCTDDEISYSQQLLHQLSEEVPDNAIDIRHKWDNIIINKCYVYMHTRTPKDFITGIETYRSRTATQFNKSRGVTDGVFFSKRAMIEFVFMVKPLRSRFGQSPEQYCPRRASTLGNKGCYHSTPNGNCFRIGIPNKAGVGDSVSSRRVRMEDLASFWHTLEDEIKAGRNMSTHFMIHDCGHSSCVKSDTVGTNYFHLELSNTALYIILRPLVYLLFKSYDCVFDYGVGKWSFVGEEGDSFSSQATIDSGEGCVTDLNIGSEASVNLKSRRTVDKENNDDDEENSDILSESYLIGLFK